MITTLLFDFSRVILNVKDKNYSGLLNTLYKEMSSKPDYNFFNYFELNKELLKLLETIKSKCPLYIFTTGSIQNVPEVRKRIDPIFRKIYSAEELELDKKDPQSYLYISKDLGKSPEEILFTDDQSENIKAAETAGLKAVRYQSNEQLISELSKIMVI